MGKKAALHTLGCKVNAYETEAMQQLLEKNGYEIVSFSEQADVYIINTCTVTSIADRKSKQMIRRAKKQNPDAVVVAVGCYVQAFEEELKAEGIADLIIGNNQKSRLPQLLEKRFEEIQTVIDIAHTKQFEEMEIYKTESHTRAFLKVQDGCNQFCSYCMIPYARGRSRSRKASDVAAEVRRLAASGCKEVVLTGIHLSSYGKDLDNEVDLADLVMLLEQIDGLARIRLGSLEPGVITEAFIGKIEKCSKFCPHFHLSLQSGSDTVLRRMNRHYTTQMYEEKCEIIRKHFEHPAITTDIIVGFPGETEDEFLQTLNFVKKIQFYEVHVFKYSIRKGTKAANMKNQVPSKIKTERSHKLIALTGQLSEEFRAWYQGKMVELLLEEPIQMEGKSWMVGHTREYVKCAVEEGESNTLIQAKVGDFLNSEILLGEK